MSIEIKVPVLPESVADATVAKWYKKVGDVVARDEQLVDLETDKVMLEVPAPAPGVITKILVKEGQTVKAGTQLAILTEGEAGTVKAAAKADKTEKTSKAEGAEPTQPPAAEKEGKRRARSCGSTNDR